MDDLGRTAWAPKISKSDGPVYIAIADALAADILSGALAAGSQLPTQRSLAETLGIDFTTVSRAYAEARRRGLIEGRVGQGTFVRRQNAALAPSMPLGLVDMSMNLPPRVDDAGLAARMWSGIVELEASGGIDLLLRYQEPGGAAPDRAAGAHWLTNRLPGLTAERVLICPGTQGALLAVAGFLTTPGGVICCEALTYPGFRALAAHLGIRLVAIAMDGEGLIPEAFDEACRKEAPKALYCTPTHHNPTTATMSLERRKAIVAVARQHDVPIIEDDAYGFLPRHSPPPLASLAPELVHYIAGLAKCLSPALRTAYLVPPSTRLVPRLVGAIRAVASISSPLTVAIATRWIQNGTAAAVLAAIRSEAIIRQEIAKTILPPTSFAAKPESFHLWLSLPASWTRAEFVARLRAIGIGVVGSDAFALEAAPEAVRLSLGAPATRNELRLRLEQIADLLTEQPMMSSIVV
jgi:DNA-binding transcriptional MocR family regulator